MFGRSLARRQKGADPFAALRERMDRMFDDWLGGGEFPSYAMETERGLFTPRVDVTQDEEVVRVVAELPGLDAGEVKVHLLQDRLVIEGEKKAEREETRDAYHWRERTFGSFRREIPLPCEVERDKSEAGFAKGVLTVTLTKSPAAQKRTLEIPIRTD